MISTTTNDMIEQVRSLIDEDNLLSVSDNDILTSLNRAQRFGSNILARHYEEPLLKSVEAEIVNGRSEYPLPEDIFEDRLEKVEFNTFQGNRTDIIRISYRDLSAYESDVRSNVPAAYAIIGKKYRIVPTPSGRYNARIWYLRRPDALVTSQGRITKSNPAGNYIIVDSIGNDLTTEQDKNNSYVNIVDGDTGIIKYSAQLKTIDGNKLLFKTTPSRTEVGGRTIGSDFTALTTAEGDPLTLNPDDLVCVVEGVCIPQLQDPMGNFMIEYAVAEMTRKMGGPADSVQRTLMKFQEQVERSWVGREQSRRVKKRNKHFHARGRRWFFPSNDGSF